MYKLLYMLILSGQIVVLVFKHIPRKRLVSESAEGFPATGRLRAWSNVEHS